MRVIPALITRSGSRLDKLLMPQAIKYESPSQTSHLVGAKTVRCLLQVNVFESAIHPLNHLARHKACKRIQREKKTPCLSPCRCTQALRLHAHRHTESMSTSVYCKLPLHTRQALMIRPDLPRKGSACPLTHIRPSAHTPPIHMPRTSTSPTC